MKKESSIQLVSSSPRRLEILKQVYNKVCPVSFGFDESIPVNIPASKVSEYLSLHKMDCFLASNVNKQSKIVTADTIVCYPEENRILGKPTSTQEAMHMLLYHFGKSHTVITSACYFEDGRKTIITDEAIVKFKNKKDVQDEVIERYLQLTVPDGPLDKAGAYGIQEHDVCRYMIESVTGDVNTVIGFPLEKFVSVIVNGSSRNT